jgi:hypothetical protein
MSNKIKMLLAMLVMLGLAGSAQATPYYFWNWGVAGDWANPAIWADSGNPLNEIPTPTQVGGNQAMLCASNQLVTVTTPGQGAVDLIVGYAWPNIATLRVNAGINFTTANLMIGMSSGNGIFDLYGTASSSGLRLGCSADSNGTMNIHDGATFTNGTLGCNIGETGTGTINMTGTGSLVTASPVTMNGLGRIDIEAGSLKVLGNYVTQLQGYVNNHWITSHGGVSPRCVPAVSFHDSYTWVTTSGCTCTTYLPADINHDCYVDMFDIAVFAQNWLVCINPTDANCTQ